MKKGILFLVSILVMCLVPMTAFAANKLPTKLEAPSAIHIRDDADFEEGGYGSGGTSLWISFNKGKDLCDMLALEYDFNEYYDIDDFYRIYAQIDWSIDNQNNWQYRSYWDKGLNANDDDVNNLNGEYVHIALSDDTTQEEQFFNIGTVDNEWDGWTKEWSPRLPKNVYTTLPNGWGEPVVIINWNEHTLYVRMRFYISYREKDSEVEKFIFSDWSDVVSFGKGVKTFTQPTSLETPAVSKLVLTDKVFNGGPVLDYTLTNPQSVKDSSAGARSIGDDIVLQTQVNIGGKGWVDVQGDIDISDGVRDAKLSTATEKVDESTWVQLRTRYHYRVDPNSGRKDLYSDWSNITQIGAPAWGNASAWATNELQQANELDLIPEVLKGADLTKSITRAEFAAVSVKTYEALSGIKAIPNAVNPFKDTNDVEVLKAYNLGITTGTSDTTFDPNTLLNREQAATMLTRTFKRASMNGWTIATDTKFGLTYTKPAPFADDSKISSWAKDSVYFMAANGIINGVGDNKFAPQNTTSEEQAIGYANATREQALLMATRMVLNLDK